MTQSESQSAKLWPKVKVSAQIYDPKWKWQYEKDTVSESENVKKVPVNGGAYPYTHIVRVPHPPGFQYYLIV